MQIKIDLDIERVRVFLNDFRFRALVNATRKSINRTVSSTRTYANRKARETRKLKAGEINRKFFSVTKARGSRLDQLEGALIVSGKPISLIRFVVGQKDPRNQKGVPAANRKSVRVEVRPGRKVKLSSAFIAKGRGGQNQVFRRRGKSRFPIVKQSVPSLARVFARDEIRRSIEEHGHDKLGKEFDRTFNFELTKAIKRMRG